MMKMVLSMDNQEIRKHYFQKKKSYQIFYTLLTLFRGLGALLLISMVVFVVMYSIYGNGSEWENAFDAASKVFRVLIPVVLCLWIISKIIVTKKKNYLLYLKRKSDIIDEI